MELVGDAGNDIGPTGAKQGDGAGREGQRRSDEVGDGERAVGGMEEEIEIRRRQLRVLTARKMGHDVQLEIIDSGKGGVGEIETLFGVDLNAAVHIGGAVARQVAGQRAAGGKGGFIGRIEDIRDRVGIERRHGSGNRRQVPTRPPEIVAGVEGVVVRDVGWADTRRAVRQQGGSFDGFEIVKQSQIILSHETRLGIRGSPEPFGNDFAR